MTAACFLSGLTACARCPAAGLLVALSLHSSIPMHVHMMGPSCACCFVGFLNYAQVSYGGPAADLFVLLQVEGLANETRVLLRQLLRLQRKMNRGLSEVGTRKPTA